MKDPVVVPFEGNIAYVHVGLRRVGMQCHSHRKNIEVTFIKYLFVCVVMMMMIVSVNYNCILYCVN